jgi:hypothetical protein
MIGCSVRGMPDYLEDIVGYLQKDTAVERRLEEDIVVGHNSKHTQEKDDLVVDLHLAGSGFGDMELPLGDLGQRAVAGFLIALVVTRMFWP